MKHDLALLLLRLPGLYLALAHGLDKVLDLATGRGDKFIAGVERLGFPMPAAFAWAAALAELLGGLLVALGLYTRIAASLAAFTMFVAAFFRHRAHLQLLSAMGLVSYPSETVEAWGKPELALLYLAVFVGVLLLGPGAWSLDGALRGKGGKGRAKRA